MGVNWQERKTERACGMRWGQEGGAGGTGTAGPSTAAATAGLGRMGAADMQEAVLGLALGKPNMGRWVVGRVPWPCKAQETRALAHIWLYAVKLLLKVLTNAPYLGRAVRGT